MRIAVGDHHELTVGSVDHNRKEEAGVAGQTIRRGSMTIRLGVVLKYMKGG